MNEINLLSTIAEVAASYAGFVTLAALIGKRSNYRMMATRVIALLVLSLMVVIFALAPGLVFLFNIDTDAVWSAASGIFGIVLTVYWSFMLNRLLSRPKGTHVPLLNRINTLGTHPLCILLLVTISLGFWGELAAAIYTLVLVIVMIVAGSLFVQIVYEMLDTEEKVFPSFKPYQDEM